MSRLWLAWALGMGGCVDTYTESAAAPMADFELSADSPEKRVVVTVLIGEPGLPRRGQLEAARVDLNLTAQHFVDTCPPNRECTHQITIDADGYASSRNLSLEHGGMAQGGAIVADLFADCLPQQACSQRVAFDLTLIGEDFVSVQAFADARYTVQKRSDPDLEPLRVDLELESVSD